MAAARPTPSPSRELSFSRADQRSRRSLNDTNPNVFSDDYELESGGSSGDTSPVNSIQPTEHDFPRESINITPYPAVPNRLSNLNRSENASNRQMSMDNNSSVADGGLDRTLSTSSRFSFPRPSSPYNGPTAPSHPYAMYPQVTRASSVASESASRPHQETPFVPRGGPEHPYSLYPQNTVPEEDEDITAGGIPLGFPGAVNYQSSTGASSSDVGDIIGSDGHIEQLPPYTRYADNVVDKGDMAAINGPTLVDIPEPSTEEEEMRQMPSTTTSTEQLEVDQPHDLAAEQAKKECWREKAQKKICGVVPLWCLVAIIGVVILAAALGGVIGGVVGNRAGADRAMAAKAATTTVWLDADPATMGPSTPSLPTGRYAIPLNQSQEINSCVVEDAYGTAWGCMDIAFIGMSVIQTAPDQPMQVVFDDYSLNTTDFRYGPQPPDFNGSAFDLKPYKDRDNAQLGVAMFFSVLFDKLSIIPSYALTPINDKHSMSRRELDARTAHYDGIPLEIGDQPWYCFWNSTINEFWIFLEESNPPESSSTITTMSSSATETAKSSSMATSGAIAQELTLTTSSYTPVYTAYNPSFQSSYESSPPDPSPTENVKRSYATRSPYVPEYPRLIKMVEKRKPGNNIQPYCQRMQVLNNWEIVPTEDQEIVCIEENDFIETTSPSGGNRRRDATNQLESNCICEWLSI